MLIDELIHSSATPVSGNQNDVELAKAALKMLPMAARYDVNNIWKALHDHRADQTRMLASKAPAYPKWDSAWLEYKYDGKHRRGILLTWLKQEGRYACDLFSEAREDHAAANTMHDLAYDLLLLYRHTEVEA